WFPHVAAYPTRFAATGDVSIRKQTATSSLPFLRTAGRRTIIAGQRGANVEQTWSKRRANIASYEREAFTEKMRSKLAVQDHTRGQNWHHLCYTERCRRRVSCWMCGARRTCTIPEGGRQRQPIEGLPKKR